MVKISHVIVGLIFSSAIAVAQAPAPSETPAALLSKALRALHQNEFFSCTITSTRRTESTKPIDNVEHQALVNRVRESTLSVYLAQPGSISIQCQEPNAHWSETLHDDRILFTSSRSGSDKPANMLGGEFDHVSIENILQTRASFTRLTQPAIARLFDKTSDTIFFKYCKKWNWQGQVADNEIDANLISFVDPDDTEWSVTISRNPPFHILRLRTTAESNVSVSIMQQDGANDAIPQEPVDSSNYPIRVQIEYVFRNFDTTKTAVENRFEFPAGEVRYRDYFSDKPHPGVGDIIELTDLETPSGKIVKPGAQEKTVILSFWRVQQGKTYVASPKLQELLKQNRNARTRWYAINAWNRTTTALNALKQDKIEGDHLFIAPTARYRDEIEQGNSGRVLVIDVPTKKVIYNDYAGSDGVALAKLSELLQSRATVKD